MKNEITEELCRKFVDAEWKPGRTHTDSVVKAIAADWLRLNEENKALREQLLVFRKRPHFECPECGPYIKADEDGCCATCGRDAVIIDTLEAGMRKIDELRAMVVNREKEVIELRLAIMSIGRALEIEDAESAADPEQIIGQAVIILGMREKFFRDRERLKKAISPSGRMDRPIEHFEEIVARYRDRETKIKLDWQD